MRARFLENQCNSSQRAVWWYEDWEYESHKKWKFFVRFKPSGKYPGGSGASSSQLIQIRWHKFDLEEESAQKLELSQNLVILLTWNPQKVYCF